MDDLRERIRQEEEVWDRNVAARRGRIPPPRPYERRFRGEPVVDGVRRMIGPSVAGLRILDVGCGVGDTAMAFAMGGAEVTGIDVSGVAIDTARETAERHGLTATFRQVAFEEFEGDESFDLVFGCGSLHHVSLPHAMAQARRLLQPGGRAVFSEPYGNNPLFEWARRVVRYPGQEAHAVDRPLTRREIEEAAAPHFERVELEPHRLAEIVPWFLETAVKGSSPALHRAFSAPLRALRAAARALDRVLLTLAPGLADYCQIVNIRLTAPKTTL